MDELDAAAPGKGTGLVFGNHPKDGLVVGEPETSPASLDASQLEQREFEDQFVPSLSAIRRATAALRKPPVDKFGAIDVGTNSIHLVMVEVSPDGDFRILGRDKELVQLGKGGFVQHVLTAPAMEKGIATLKRFVKMARLREIGRLKVVATSAVREARNGGEFVRRVRDQLGLDLHVISAEEEARLIYLAVRHAVDLGGKDNLIIDLGGGSLEIIVGNVQRPEILSSLKLGASRLAELFLRSDPPAPVELKALRHHIEATLTPLSGQIGAREFARCIVTSGTIENVAAICAYRRGLQEIEPSTQLRIETSEVKSLISELSGMSRAHRVKIRGMDERRADAILPAVMLLQALMRTFGVSQVEHCDMALREGVILDHIARHRSRLQAQATWPDPRTRSVVQFGERCGYRREHAEQVARLALSLFDQLAPVHKLDARYRELLRDGCLLHDIGYMISHESHHKHSYYLIRNGGLQGFSGSEVEVIANVARYHRKGRPKKSHYSYCNLDKDDRAAVRMLIPLIRLANALDRTHYCVVDSVICRLESASGLPRGRSTRPNENRHGEPDRVRVLVHTKKDAELELWTAAQHRRLFEKEFKIGLDVALAETNAKESFDAEHH